MGISNDSTIIYKFGMLDLIIKRHYKGIALADCNLIEKAPNACELAELS